MDKIEKIKDWLKDQIKNESLNEQERDGYENTLGFIEAVIEGGECEGDYADEEGGRE